jgi:hypothetical protein
MGQEPCNWMAPCSTAPTSSRPSSFWQGFKPGPPSIHPHESGQHRPEYFHNGDSNANEKYVAVRFDLLRNGNIGLPPRFGTGNIPRA